MMAIALKEAGGLVWPALSEGLCKFSGCLWIGLLALHLLPGSVCAQNQEKSPEGQAKQALARQGFPWYDAEKDELIPLFPKKTDPPRPAREELAQSNQFEAGGIVRAILWLLLAVVIGAVILAVIWYGQSLLEIEPPVRQVETDLEMETGRLEALPEAVRGKGDLLARARELAAAKAFSEAIVFLHGWQLIQLDKHGKIELQKGKTNRQYLGELSTAPAELRQTFGQSTRLFEDAFYGHLEISEAEFQTVWSKMALFEKAMPIKAEKITQAKKRMAPAKGSTP